VPRPVGLPEPAPDRTDVKQQFLDYLAFYRQAIVGKLRGLSDDDLRASRLPSGWSPLEMLKHVLYVERRWLQWGFGGQDLDDVWGDRREGRWAVAPDDTLESLVDQWEQLAKGSTALIEGAELTDLAPPGERFEEGTATLMSILFHVLQEFARHAGHLDIVRELIDGTTGE
jgi:uncharacterized damage-inducible protein DinB